MPELKLAKVKEENADEQYRPGTKEAELINELTSLFEIDQNARDEDLKRLLNDRTLENFLDDCQKRVNGYVEPRVDADDWWTRYRSLMTRNKLVALMAKMATVRVKMKFSDKFGGGDQDRLKIFNAKYNYEAKRDNEDVKQFEQMWATWQDGTHVVWDTPEKKTKKFKQVIKYDPETGETETTEKIIEFFKHTSKSIPLQDIWFGNIWQSDVQKQPHIWLRFEPHYQEFLEDYGKLKNAKKVKTASGDDTPDVFYRENQMEKNKVEVLYYLNIWEDRMVILANKVVLYDGIIPFGDENEGKHYPLSVSRNEILAPGCIYGKSGADNLKGDQDMYDLFMRKLADRAVQVSNPPIFSEGNPDLPETITAKPNHVYEVDNLAGIREFAFANNSSEVVQALQMFKAQADRTSISDASSGAAQPNRTATADAIAEQATRQIVGLQQFFHEDFSKNKAEIRARHILQFIDVPEKKIIDDETDEVKLEYGVFTDRNVILDDGTRGDMIYQIYGSVDELPTQRELDIKEAVAAKQNYNVQYKGLTPDYFEGLITQVEAVAGSSVEQSPALLRRLEAEFQRGFLTFFPEFYQANKEEFAKDYIESYEKDVDRLMRSPGGQPDQMALPQNLGQVTPEQQQVPPELQQLANI